MDFRRSNRNNLTANNSELSGDKTIMARQGRVFTAEEIQKIVWLLSTTDMTMKQIAERMRCSHSAVVSINRKTQVRLYEGRRTSWVDLKSA
jgi:hypothetical protein